jgi:SpoVK/Ycf46/Vps4 family AAA+-type ATPase
LAEALGVPFLVVQYTGVIGQSLSVTMVRLRRIFEYARTRHCVLFYDEFETIGKERGDPHDTDTLKRAVGSLLVEIDALPSSVVLVVATNHLELLDRAAWRRFQVRLSLPKPDYEQVQEWFTRLRQQRGVPLSPALIGLLAERLDGSSFAELEEVGNDILRRWVLAGGSGDIETIVHDRLDQRTKRFVSAY